jgi:diguanylate cyclase (GGDEF)-like protein/PAS domain S-box-containing protein
MLRLQQRAETELQQSGIPLSETIETTSPAPLQQTLYDLRVHQIELKMQNEELRRQQDELDTSQARYFDFYDMAPVGYFSVDESGLIEQANLTTAALLGISRIVLVRQQITHFILPEDQDIFYLMRQKIINTREPQFCELRFVKQDGTKFWAHLDALAVPDQGGALTMRIVMTDITEPKRTEEALRDSARRWQTTFDAAQDAICLLGNDQRILQANAAMAELTRISVEDMIGRHCWEVVHATTGPIPECPLRRSRTSLRREQMDLQIGERWLHITVDPVLGPSLAFQGAVHIMRDISERKQLEEQVRQMALHDGLTGLPNRRLLIDRLTQAVNFSKRTERHGALIFLDLDNFKTLNDNYGHEAGDLLLMEVGRRLRSCVREIDTVARFGGDEYAVLLGDLMADKVESTKQARIIAEKVRARFAEPYFLTIRSKGDVAMTIEHLCTASIGVAVFGNDQRSEDDIVRHADTAMYKAKQEGRSLVRFSEEAGQL